MSREPTKRRSLSTYMLCSQDIDTVRETARAATKEASAESEPKGAAALLEDLSAIDSDGKPALRIEEEAEKDGRAGHVGIRFALHVIAAGDAERRRVRAALISTFGQVATIDRLRRDRCG